ncbi:hypothetical protein [Streptomyces sp. NPDC005476]|uniref:hypothetical protein n=1 Tax=Streptomyces sp. NPDC005476 TaxID=3156882 RepID=UPI0034532E7B
MEAEDVGSDEWAPCTSPMQRLRRALQRARAALLLLERVLEAVVLPGPVITGEDDVPVAFGHDLPVQQPGLLV